VSCIPWPCTGTRARDRFRTALGTDLSEFPKRGACGSLRTSGPGGAGKEIQLLATSPIQAELHRVQVAPTTNILKHHFAVKCVLVRPIDHHRPTLDVIACNVLKGDWEYTSPGTCDRLEALHDAVEVCSTPSTTIAHHHHSRALLAWRASFAAITQRLDPVALPTMFTFAEARI